MPEPVADAVEQGGAPAPEVEPELIAVVMSPKAARQLAAACQWGKFRALEALDLGGAKTPLARAQAAEAYEWLDWGSHWMLDGRRLDVPDG